MIYALPVLGWLIGFLLSFFIAIPFYFLWNWLAPVYLDFLPSKYLALPFWHCVGLFMLGSMLRILLLGDRFSGLSVSTKK